MGSSFLLLCFFRAFEFFLQKDLVFLENHFAEFQEIGING